MTAPAYWIGIATLLEIWLKPIEERMDIFIEAKDGRGFRKCRDEIMPLLDELRACSGKAQLLGERLDQIVTDVETQLAEGLRSLDVEELRQAIESARTPEVADDYRDELGRRGSLGPRRIQ